MANWFRVCSVDECPPGQARELVAGDRVIALFHIDARFYALDGICPHQGGPLGKGTLCGGMVTCPWHGWQFDVATGRHQTIPSLAQAGLPVRIEGDDVFVDLNG
jgi:nitrite reductase (NADH) small subunit